MRFIARHRKFFNVTIAIVCILLFSFFAIRTITSGGHEVRTQVYTGIAMGTAIKKTIYAEDITVSDRVDKMIDETLQELENQISVRKNNSEISKLNSSYVTGGTNKLSDNVLQCLEVEIQVWRETEGAFSPCIYPITSLWGIEEGLAEIPDEALLQERILSSDANNIEVVEDGIILNQENMAIDLGAVGKGLACDMVKEQLMQTEIRGAVVSIGGSILAYGDKGDGKDWHIGIQDPRNQTGEVLGIIDVDGDVVVSTSGDYEKYFELDGKRYHHIFDPITGYPADNGLISVSVVSDSGLLSDALSTACFVLGLEEGMNYVQEKGVEAVFVTSDMNVYVTKGLKKKFRLKSDEYTLVK
ncbi:MAG: FAD:protein FMN transferase [Lachnospiraceae bacterium]|nr:FAD:protein FMN transferase [Lachnospiraceae bacterium]